MATSASAPQHSASSAYTPAAPDYYASYHQVRPLSLGFKVAASCHVSRCCCTCLLSPCTLQLQSVAFLCEQLLRAPGLRCLGCSSAKVRCRATNQLTLRLLGLLDMALRRIQLKQRTVTHLCQALSSQQLTLLSAQSSRYCRTITPNCCLQGVSSQPAVFTCMIFERRHQVSCLCAGSVRCCKCCLLPTASRVLSVPAAVLSALRSLLSLPAPAACVCSASIPNSSCCCVMDPCSPSTAAHCAANTCAASSASSCTPTSSSSCTACKVLAGTDCMTWRPSAYLLSQCV